MYLGTRWGVWSATRPGRLVPRRDPVPIIQEAGWASEPLGIGAENLTPAGIRFPDLAARSESLYRLSYPGSYLLIFKVRKQIYVCRSNTEELIQVRDPRFSQHWIL